MTDYNELRELAFDNTLYQLSKEILTQCPSLVWHEGAKIPSIEGHYQDFNFNGAICCTSSEAMLLHFVSKYSNANFILEIGSYVGWSSIHLAKGNPRALIICVDSLEEHNNGKKVKSTFYQNIKQNGVAHQVFMINAHSPEILNSIVPENGWDIAFLDGFHRDGQPLKDVVGLWPTMNEKGIIVLHDTWMPDVSVAVKHLTSVGYKMIKVNTVNELSFFFLKEPVWWKTFTDQVNKMGLQLLPH